MSKKLGQEPAFPGTHKQLMGMRMETLSDSGISKRYWTAVMLLQGILSAQNDEKLIFSFEETLPKLAFMYADALLEQEN